jgi:phytoene dehydrogenase-like protein
LDGKEVIDHEEFVRIEDGRGRTLVLHTDMDRLERNMKELSADDARVIEEFCNAVRSFSRLEIPLGKPRELWGFRDKLKMFLKILPHVRAFGKYGRISVQDFSARFKDPFLREAFSHALAYDLHQPMTSLILMLSWMHNQNAGYPMGGSSEFSQDIARRYLNLGGEISYKSRVEEILTQCGDGVSDMAVGVRLSDGSEHHADYVVSAADGHTTIFEMLEERYLDDEIRGYYNGLAVYPPIIQVSLGVSTDLSSTPSRVTYLLGDSMVIAGKDRGELHVKHYGFDPTLAPPGKSVLIVSMDSNFAYWESLYKDRDRYVTEKRHIVKKVISRLEEHYPGLSDVVEVVDVATPMTTKRYTGNWRGSIQAWMDTPEKSDIDKRRTLPGLEQFYMAGQWAEARGGLPSAAISGRDVIQLICERDGKLFRAHARTTDDRYMSLGLGGESRGVDNQVRGTPKLDSLIESRIGRRWVSPM